MEVLSYLGLGIIHEKRGVSCQDYISCKCAENGNNIVALSDGAGSAKYAETAAKNTVRAIIDYFSKISLKQYLGFSEREQKEEIISCVLIELKKAAKKKQCSNLREFSSTLLFCVGDCERMIFFHLGDGAILATDEACNPVYYSDPDNVEGSLTRTYFCVSHHAVEHSRIASFSSLAVHRVLMTSDGAYEMFQNRGDGDACQTMLEILSYHRNHIISTVPDFADILNQMAEIPSERFDDWSIALIWNHAVNRLQEVVITSMLDEEKEKYSQTQIME